MGATHLPSILQLKEEDFCSSTSLYRKEISTLMTELLKLTVDTNATETLVKRKEGEELSDH